MLRNEKTRDAALQLLEETRTTYLFRARTVAFQLYYELRRPICVDDIRKVCPPPSDIDPRVMGAIFSGKDWLPVGWTLAKGHCNARPVRTFVPANQKR